MSEVKFACPHCRQHIACDSDYADMCIVCPSCQKPMEVPRLSAADASHPAMYLVASVPAPKQRFSSRIPTIDLWREKEWDERYRAMTTPEQPTPAWVMSGVGTLIAAAVLKAARAPAWGIILCVLAGTALSAYLVYKRRMIATVPLGTAGTFVKVIAGIGLLILAIPAVALGILFIGCTVCH
jgi:hypothetical protein